MSNRIILVQSAFWLGITELISKVVMFGVTIGLVRCLGPKDFGAFNLAFSYVALFMIAGDFGLNTVSTRDVAKNKKETEKYLGNLLGLKISLSLLITLLILLSFIFVPTNTTRSMILAVLLYNLSQNLSGVFVAIFSAWEKMQYVFVARITYYLGILVSALGVIALKGSAMQVVLAYAVTTIVSLIVSILLARGMKVKIKVLFEKEFWEKILRETVPFMGLAVVGTIYANADTLLIGKFFGSREVGFYQAAYKILFAFQSINVINNAIFPRINVLIQEKKQETLRKLIRMVITYSVIGLLPLAAFITIFQSQIVKAIYGSVYLSAAPAMAILVWAGVVNYFRIFASNLLFARHKQKQVFYAVSVGLVCSLLINLLVMPRYGFVVSSVSVLLSEIIVLGFIITKYIKR